MSIAISCVLMGVVGLRGDGKVHSFVTVVLAFLAGAIAAYPWR